MAHKFAVLCLNLCSNTLSPRVSSRNNSPVSCSMSQEEVRRIPGPSGVN